MAASICGSRTLSRRATARFAFEIINLRKPVDIRKQVETKPLIQPNGTEDSQHDKRTRHALKRSELACSPPVTMKCKCRNGGDKDG